jgi:hypothetical protein
VINLRSGLTKLLALGLMVLVGGCASTKQFPPPSDSVEFLTRDYRFADVMKSNQNVKGWARDTLDVVNELQYQLELEKQNK